MYFPVPLSYLVISCHNAVIRPSNTCIMALDKVSIISVFKVPYLEYGTLISDLFASVCRSSVVRLSPPHNSKSKRLQT